MSRTDEGQLRRNSERYARLRELDRQAYDAAAMIGSLVQIEGGSLRGNLKLAAKVEGAVVTLCLDVIERARQ